MQIVTSPQKKIMYVFIFQLSFVYHSSGGAASNIGLSLRVQAK